MLENKSKDFKTLVLLRLTKKLIENTESYGIFRLEQILKKQMEVKPEKEPEVIIKKTQEELRENFKEEIKKEVKEKLKMMPSRKIDEEILFGETSQISKGTPRLPQPRKQPIKRPIARTMPTQAPMAQRRPIPTQAPAPNQRQKLMAPPQGGSELPAHLQYLKPTEPPQQPLNIDLGKLNPFLQDPNVKEIETEGEDETVTVKGKMGKKPTNIKLSKEEIDEILDKFSKESKIPKTEGLFKVTLGNIVLTAMVSNTISSRFIIKKV